MCCQRPTRIIMARYITNGYGNHPTGPLGSLKIYHVNHATRKNTMFEMIPVAGWPHRGFRTSAIFLSLLDECCAFYFWNCPDSRYYETASHLLSVRTSLAHRGPNYRQTVHDMF